MLKVNKRILSVAKERIFMLKMLKSRGMSSGGKEDPKLWIRPEAQNVTGYEGKTITEVFWKDLNKHEKSPAIECGITGRKYNHGQIYALSCAFATSLHQAGLRRGDVVGILLPNIPEFAIVTMGIWLGGFIISPLNPTYTSDEIGSQYNLAEAKIIITIPQLVETIKKAAERIKSFKSIIVIGEAQEGCHTFSEMLKVKPNEELFLKGSQIDAKETIAALPFSSGTTGNPKGVALTHTNITSNLLQQIPYAASTCKDGDQEVLLGVLPFFHIYGLNVVLALTLYKGSHLITLPKFEPPSFIQTLKKYKFTRLHLVPPLAAFIANSPDVKTKDLSSVGSIMLGAAPTGPTTIKKLIEKVEKEVFIQEGYGLTELSPVSHMIRRETGNSKIGTIGALLPNTEAKVVDSDGNTIGRNKSGELCFRGPQVMKGYYKNEAATKETIDADGWFHSGDIGYCDDDGDFYIVDRLKELIKTKGLQVAPSELEDLIRKIEGVADVAVIGVPDEKAGELPRAYIVRNNENLTKENINEFLNDKIAPHKKLKGGIEFVELIPKAASGKILRRELKKKYEERA